MSIVLLGLAGLLVGGAITLRQQSTSKAPFVITLLLAALSAAGGLLWL
ncbi:hypothetical protein ACFPIJ_19735 [Dactylosporangium cerinum]|uniref:Amidotransferase n=1 Tax=Dactylosporangium cerinum TaxID=1434730 RepID=A0ABV9VUF9_9ACTN